MKTIVAFIFCLVYAVYGQDPLAVSDHAKSVAVVLRLSRELGLTDKREAQVYIGMQKPWSEIESAKGKEDPYQGMIDGRTFVDLKKILTKSAVEIKSRCCPTNCYDAFGPGDRKHLTFSAESNGLYKR